MPSDWLFWSRYDTAMLSGASELWVYTMDGWENSKGVSAEIEIAKSLKLPIKFINERLKFWTLPTSPMLGMHSPSTPAGKQDSKPR
jgi:hypothetical protein